MTPSQEALAALFLVSSATELELHVDVCVHGKGNVCPVSVQALHTLIIFPKPITLSRLCPVQYIIF